MQPIRSSSRVDQEQIPSKAPKEKRARDEAVDKASKTALNRPVKPAPLSPVSPAKLNNEGIKRLRYAQASMKDTTRDGLPVQELAKNMAKKGYDRRHPIHVVTMPPGPDDSPLKPNETGKLVAYDTRRTKAARQAAHEEEEFFAYVKMKDHREIAEADYESLRHLTFENKAIPTFVRRVWVQEWNKWHDPQLLKENDIIPKSWGHLIKLRMAMSLDKSRSNQAKTSAGFKESPFVREAKKPSRPPEAHSKPARRAIFK